MRSESARKLPPPSHEVPGANAAPPVLGELRPPSQSDGTNA